MEIKEALTQAMQEVCRLYMLKSELRGEAVKSSLCSTEPINVLIGFSMSLRGNVVFGFNKSAAMKLVSVINGVENAAFDAKTKSSLGEFARFTLDLAISKSQMVKTVSLSPPIIVTGENIFLMIGQVKTVQLAFGLDEDLVSVSYYLEQGSKSSSAYYIY